MPIQHGSNRLITTAAARLTPNAIPNKAGLRVKAGGANAAKVYLGQSSGVTAASTPGLDGYELAAGQEIELPPSVVSSTDLLWLVSTAATQVVYFLLLGAVTAGDLGWALDFSQSDLSGYLPLF